MLKPILIFGTISGLIVAAEMFAFTVPNLRNGHSDSAYMMVIGYLTMLVALSAVFVAIKRHRDISQGGVIRFWPAFGMGLGISLVCGIFYALSWETVLAVTHMDFADDYAKSMISGAAAKGASPEALAKVTADMAKFKAQYNNPLYRLPMTFAEIFPVGVLVSLVSAGLLRNSRFLPIIRR
jgi:Protein of unknown function (DUF4199)